MTDKSMHPTQSKAKLSTNSPY